jgi:hypothetical protein
LGQLTNVEGFASPHCSPAMDCLIALYCYDLDVDDDVGN